jgi:hypothetical protein
MSADADHWWRNRREASANPGDGWSGGGRAYRRWMGAELARAPRKPAPAGQEAAASAAARETPLPPAPAQAETTVARGAERGGWIVPRAPRLMPIRAFQNVARRFRTVADALLPVLRGTPAARVGSRKRLQASLGLGAAGLGAVLCLAPLAWAGHWHPCAAAEVALVDDAIGHGSSFEASKRRVANWTGPDGKLLSHGRVGRQIAAEEHAGWPSLAGCTALFWRVRAEDASLHGITPVLVRAVSARR